MGERRLDSLLPPRPQEHCGVLGITGTEDAARNAYFGLYAIQHRGQESAGIASTNGSRIYVHKDMGLVPSVFDEKDIKKLKGESAIGQTRYSTYGGSNLDHAQPASYSKRLALALNGNNPEPKKLLAFADQKGLDTKGLNDTGLMYLPIDYHLKRGASLADAVQASYPLFGGAFAVVAMTNKETVAFQDPYAMKPLSLGKLNGGYIFASETSVFDTVNASLIRDVGPGEMIVVDNQGLQARQLVENAQLIRDSWEYVYFGRPDSVMLGQLIYAVRERFGRQLAKEHPADADIVVPIPNGGTIPAVGYHLESGIPYTEAMVKNHYIGRTFIQPGQRQRDMGVEVKLNPIDSMIRGKRIVLVDDSIVRGTTTPRIIERLKRAGAEEVHVRISSPTYRFPDFYGTDTPNQEKLIAAMKNVEAIREAIGATTLGYLSYEGFLEAIGIPEENLSNSWHTGEYPISIGDWQNKIFTPAA